MKNPKYSNLISTLLEYKYFIYPRHGEMCLLGPWMCVCSNLATISVVHSALADFSIYCECLIQTWRHVHVLSCSRLFFFFFSLFLPVPFLLRGCRTGCDLLKFFLEYAVSAIVLCDNAKAVLLPRTFLAPPRTLFARPLFKWKSSKKQTCCVVRLLLRLN